MQAGDNLTRGLIILGGSCVIVGLIGKIIMFIVSICGG